MDYKTYIVTNKKHSMEHILSFGIYLSREKIRKSRISFLPRMPILHPCLLPVTNCGKRQGNTLGCGVIVQCVGNCVYVGSGRVDEGTRSG